MFCFRTFIGAVAVVLTGFSLFAEPAFMRVSDDRRHLVDRNGKPFFYLADTAWRFFYCTDRDMADRYMRTRKAQGFTVFMPVVLSEVFGNESETNRFGQMALVDWDPSRPNDKFFEYVDWTIDRAAEYGLVVGLLPAWGEFVGPKLHGRGPVCFTVENAYAYGLFLGTRYRDKPNLIWILGGDRNPAEEGSRVADEKYVAIWRSMALGIRAGDGHRHPMTYHPAPRDQIDAFSSADWMPDETWIDFNMLQTGTKIDRPNYRYIRRDYERTGRQAKPVLDGECRYEHSHELFYTRPPSGSRIDAHQVRKAMYNAMLSGAAGHTYGCRCVWNFYQEGAEKTRDTDMDWRQALELPGAQQVRHMRALFERYPFSRLKPDFEGKVVVAGQGTDGAYLPAAVANDRSFLLVYRPESTTFAIDLGVLNAPARLMWYDVRTGTCHALSDKPLTGVQRIVPREGVPDGDDVLIAEAVTVPAEEKRAVNPIVPEGTFFSDPAPRVGPDGRLWLFGSRDVSPDKYCSHANDVMETSDGLTWKVHRSVITSKGPNAEIPFLDWELLAPDGICQNGKWHLFYCMFHPDHAEGIVTADSPTGPYGSARELKGATQIDPSVFQDDDGTIYCTWGQFDMKMAVLKSDLSGYVEGSIRTNVINEAEHHFHEGSQLLKRNGIYYLTFADISRAGRPTAIGYATAERPFGPYTYRGVIVDNAGCDPETWNNHGGIVAYKDRWYVFYHRTTNATRSLRKACVEPIAFDEKGLIAEVEMTSSGAGPDLDPFAVTPARLACVMSGHARIVTRKDGTEFLGGIRAGDTATWRYFDFPREATAVSLRVAAHAGGSVEVRDGCGTVYGKGVIGGQGEETVVVRLDRPFPKGRSAVVFAFQGMVGRDLFELYWLQMRSLSSQFSGCSGIWHRRNGTADLLKMRVLREFAPSG